MAEESLEAMLEDIEEQLGKMIHSGVFLAKAPDRIPVDMDLALTEGPDGQPLLHIANCPEARAAAARGEFVGTLIGCTGPLPEDLPRHSCMDEAVARARSVAE